MLAVPIDLLIDAFNQQFTQPHNSAVSVSRVIQRTGLVSLISDWLGKYKLCTAQQIQLQLGNKYIKFNTQSSGIRRSQHIPGFVALLMLSYLCRPKILAVLACVSASWFSVLLFTPVMYTHYLLPSLSNYFAHPKVVCHCHPSFPATSEATAVHTQRSTVYQLTTMSPGPSQPTEAPQTTLSEILITPV
jgi:hypothetical protein